MLSPPFPVRQGQYWQANWLYFFYSHMAKWLYGMTLKLPILDLGMKLDGY